MKIARVRAHHLDNIPIQPPPFRNLPNVERAILVEIETDGGIVGWAMAGYAHPIIVGFSNKQVGPAILGEDPILIERIMAKLAKLFIFVQRDLGRAFVSALSTIDIALWDIKGKACGRPVHHLLGGARDRVPVYITHGAAYGGAPVYSVEEMAAEAKHLADIGQKLLKNTVGRQDVPGPDGAHGRRKEQLGHTEGRERGGRDEK